MFRKMKIFLMITAFLAVSFVYAEEPWEGEEPYSVSEYCLLEDGNSVLGGIFTEFFNEETTGCVPFTEQIEDYIDFGETVYSLAGDREILAVGFYNRVALYNVPHPSEPLILYEKTIYGPASDLVFNGSVLYIATENGVSSLDLDTGNFIHKHTYGTTKALRIHDDKLYVGDGQGIKVMNLDTLDIIQQRNTSGDVTKLEIMNGVIYTFEWAGLKRFDLSTLAPISTCCYNPYEPELRAYDGTLYAFGNNSVRKITFNGSSVVTTAMTGDRVELRNNHTYDEFTFFPDGNGVRASYLERQFTTPEPSDLTDQMIVLGDQIVSPYSVYSLTVARNSLINKEILEYWEVSDEDLAPTHYYIRFKPDDDEEAALLRSSGLDISDIPLDYEIAQGGSVYINPDVPAGKPSYKYAVVEVDTVLPGIDYDILEEVILEPADGEPLSGFFLNYYHLLEEESFLLKGISSELQLSWYPSGTITVVDDLLGTVPVRGVRVVMWSAFLGRRYFAVTDSNGSFTLPEGYRTGIYYKVIWQAPQREFYLEVENTGNQASYVTSTRSRLPFNFHITEAGDSEQWFYAHIFRGGEFYLNNTFNINPAFNDIPIHTWDRNGTCSYNGTRVKMYSGTSGGTHRDRSSRGIFKVTIHELAHADHHAFVVGNSCNINNIPITWSAVQRRIVEPYAMMIEAFFNDAIYGHVFTEDESRRNFRQRIRISYGEPNNFWEWGKEKYSPIAIDMIDTFDQRAAWGNTFPVDEVDGYTIHQVRDSLINVMNFWDGWRKSLRDNYTNPTDDIRLDQMFFQYIFRPTMILWIPVGDLPVWTPPEIVLPPSPPPEQM